MVGQPPRKRSEAPRRGLSQVQFLHLPPSPRSSVEQSAALRRRKSQVRFLPGVRRNNPLYSLPCGVTGNTTDSGSVISGSNPGGAARRISANKATKHSCLRSSVGQSAILVRWDRAGSNPAGGSQEHLLHRYTVTVWVASSTGQSSRLLIGGFRVRVPGGLPQPAPRTADSASRVSLVTAERFPPTPRAASSIGPEQPVSTRQVRGSSPRRPS